MTRRTTAVASVFYASQSGMSTLDQGEGGGNPFASALIELLERPSLTRAKLHSDLVALTKQKSRGFQTPDVPAVSESSRWRFKPVSTSSRRVALVFVYSDYRAAGVASLPGARHDMERISGALEQAAFRVTAVADPTRQELDAALETISTASRHADAAVIYTTGHGFEHKGEVYLMPNDYPFASGPERLPDLSVRVASLAMFLHAKRASLVCYGGCRSRW